MEVLFITLVGECGEGLCVHVAFKGPYCNGKDLIGCCNYGFCSLCHALVWNF